MKYIKYPILILITIFLNSFLEAQHYNRYNRYYETCRADLIEQDKFLAQFQAYDCVDSKLDIKILGTLLFREGSILKGL